MINIVIRAADLEPVRPTSHWCPLSNRPSLDSSNISLLLSASSSTSGHFKPLPCSLLTSISPPSLLKRPLKASQPLPTVFHCTLQLLFPDSCYRLAARMGTVLCLQPAFTLEQLLLQSCRKREAFKPYQCSSVMHCGEQVRST